MILFCFLFQFEMFFFFFLDSISCSLTVSAGKGLFSILDDSVPMLSARKLRWRSGRSVCVCKREINVEDGTTEVFLLGLLSSAVFEAC